jgi:hypothetical protein
VNAIEFTKEKRHATIASICKKPPDFQKGSNYYLVWASFGNAYSFAKEKSPPISRRALITILLGPTYHPTGAGIKLFELGCPS